MAVQDTLPGAVSTPVHDAVNRIELGLTRFLVLDGEKVAYLAIFVVAIVSRFWDLGLRVMSHDESLHTMFSYRLYNGEGFAHTPLMHGPLLFHMVALSYLLFGDSDFSARIYPALIGVIVVMLPLLMRKWLGKTGALVASGLLLISPYMLYYSRYIRHDLPSILGAMIMAYAAWKYIEERKIHWMYWLAGGHLLMFLSKEVAFIYVAVFGSFLTIFLITRMLDAPWDRAGLRMLFGTGSLVALISGAVFGVEFILLTTVEDMATIPEVGFLAVFMTVNETIRYLSAIVLAGAVLLMVYSALRGQWKNLRKFPTLDVCVVMGLLVLPLLAPFLVHAVSLAGDFLVGRISTPPAWVQAMTTFHPNDETPTGIMRSFLFTGPVFVISLIIGAVWGMQLPQPRSVMRLDPLTGQTQVVEAKRSVLEWLDALFVGNRWWAIALPYWLIFIFFFTTMFTNGNGLGTGFVGSLGYWLEQHDVRRGGQPIYYYLLIQLPLYEFLPLILSLAAGVTGIGLTVRKSQQRRAELAGAQQPESPDNLVEAADEQMPADHGLAPSEEDVLEVTPTEATFPSAQTDPPDDGWTTAPRGPVALEVTQEFEADHASPAFFFDAPIAFPVMAFIAWWAVINVIAYSLAGERMPWLTTHLTVPLCLAGGWMLGRTIERIEWNKLWTSFGWTLFPLIPIVVLALMRVLAVFCVEGSLNPLCNTVIPERYQSGLFQGTSVAALSSTSLWLTALVVLLLASVGLANLIVKVSWKNAWRVAALVFVGWLAVTTVRATWSASYVRYNEATEYLVYAHSAGGVQEVLDRIEEISFRTTDGYGLQVAYDDRVAWPMSWYLRDYENAAYFADEPTRSRIGESPVIVAGPSNWNAIDALVGDRYFSFEYTRMVWPNQDYFGLTGQDIQNILRDPNLQRGIWDIFIHRDFDRYTEAIAVYPGSTAPADFELNSWRPGERMKMWVRKDVSAQVWEYGVAAQEVAEAIDPYLSGMRDLVPVNTFGAGLLNQPHDIEIGPDGRIYVADTGNHRIAIFDQEGNLVETLGQQGLAPQEDVLNEPWGVGVGADGAVFIADTWNGRIVHYSPEGEFVRAWGVDDPGNLENAFAFWGPRDVAVGQDGLVYVADTGHKRIQVFSPDGEFRSQIGSGGSLTGQLDEPVGLRLGPDFMLYIADTWNQRIQVFTPAGLSMRDWFVEAWFVATNERPYIDVDQAGRVYLTDPEARRVLVFNTVGEFLYGFGDTNTIGLAGGIAVTDDGRTLFLVDTERGTIQRYDIGQLQP
ncbi:MAG: TIGR03663 family protein [Chloroflexi bacterium]|nr:TIGR03663 family protein [Chloroflexota bacterium]